MATREELIEEAGEEIDAAWQKRAQEGRHDSLAACAAGAALAVFEKAHAPTDDEREALEDVVAGAWAVEECDGALSNVEIADAVPAAGFRRTEVPEPSTAADSWIPHARRALHIHDTWGTPDDPDGKVRSMSDYTELSARMANALRASLAVTETKGEPSDALDLDRLERLANAATPGPWEYIFGGPEQDEDGSWYEPTESGVRSGDWENDFPHADAEFIAAVDPQTVLALIAALRAAGGVR